MRQLSPPIKNRSQQFIEHRIHNVYDDVSVSNDNTIRRILIPVIQFKLYGI
jgi:hypothetical protein